MWLVVLKPRLRATLMKCGGRSGREAFPLTATGSALARVIRRRWTSRQDGRCRTACAMAQYTFLWQQPHQSRRLSTPARLTHVMGCCRGL